MSKENVTGSERGNRQLDALLMSADCHFQFHIFRDKAALIVRAIRIMDLKRIDIGLSDQLISGDKPAVNARSGTS